VFAINATTDIKTRCAEFVGRRFATTLARNTKSPPQAAAPGELFLWRRTTIEDNKIGPRCVKRNFEAGATEARRNREGCYAGGAECVYQSHIICCAVCADVRSSWWGTGRFSLPESYAAMNEDDIPDLQRKALRLWIEVKWLETEAEYRAAGSPFGPGHGVEIWVEYRQLTTVN